MKLISLCGAGLTEPWREVCSERGVSAETLVKLDPDNDGYFSKEDIERVIHEYTKSAEKKQKEKV